MHQSVNKVVAYLLSDALDLRGNQDRVEVLELLKEIAKDNLFGTDYVLVKFISNIYAIKIGTGDLKINLDQESVERQLGISIQKLIYDQEFKLKESIRTEDIAFDLSTPKGAEDTISFFLDEALSRFTEIYSEEVTGVQARTELTSLRDEICDELYRTSVIAQGTEFNSKGFDKAYETCKKYNDRIDKLMSLNIDEPNDSQGMTRLYSFEMAQAFDAKTQGRLKPLFKMGIKPFDEQFSICNDDIVGVVAPINIGKTRFAIQQCYNCLMAGVNATMLCTETPTEKMKCSIELMHLFNTTGINDITWDKLEAIRKAPEEEQLKYKPLMDKIELCKADLYNNPKYGKLSITQDCTYEGSLEFFKRESVVYKSEVIFIDHVRDLSHSGVTPEGKKLLTPKDSLEHLSKVLKTITKRYHTAFMFFSHPSSKTSSDLSDDRLQGSTNITAGATEMSESCTRMFYLSQTTDMFTTDRVCIRETKTRNASKHINSYVLQRLGSCNVHKFDEKLQLSGNEEFDSLEDLV